MSQSEAVEDGWDDELDGIDDDYNDEPILQHGGDSVGSKQMPTSSSTPPHGPGQLKSPPPPIFWELKQYLEILPYLPRSINALLETEHNNNVQKAGELVRYYQERPGLVDYTLEKELPRMEYIWMDHEMGEPIHDDKPLVARLLMEEAQTYSHSILPRCANQSLLADLLEFLSDSNHRDSLIRRQFHMATQTRHVQFILDPNAGTVLVKATLTLTLPHPSKGMLPIATLHASCQFVPHLPLWHYHLESIQPLLKLDDNELLQVAFFLQELLSNQDLDDCPQDHYGGGDSFRDAFLQQTAMDMWNQFKHASRVSSETISAHFSLPSDDLLEQARREEEEAAQAEVLAAEQRRRIMQQKNPPPSSPGEQHSYHPQHHLNDMHQPRQPGFATQDPSETPAMERPKSILGGMFSRLAQTVSALPHEDESMYEEWRPTQQTHVENNTLSERPQQVAPAPPLRQPQQTTFPPNPSAQNLVRSNPSSASQNQYKNLLVKQQPSNLVSPLVDVDESNDGLPAMAAPSSNLVKDETRPEGWQTTDRLDSSNSVEEELSGNRGEDAKKYSLTPPEDNDDIADSGWIDEEEILFFPDEDVENKTSNQEQSQRLLDSTTNPLSTVTTTTPQTTLSQIDKDMDVVATTTTTTTTVVQDSEESADVENEAHRTPIGSHDPMIDPDWVYDPETDIIPTRKRWMNPRPGPRQLSQLLLQPM